MRLRETSAVYLILALSVVLAVLLAGCGGGSDQSGGQSGGGQKEGQAGGEAVKKKPLPAGAATTEQEGEHVPH